jgi:FkbM family methyltransferase
MRILVLRVLVFLQNVFVAIVNFGVMGAFRVHVLYRRREAKAPTYVWLKAMKRRLYFRGASDRGVVSHYFKSGYRVREISGTEEIRYIVDAGANIGDETLRFRHFHPGATVFALEADRGNFELLKLNARGDTGIVPLHKALWSEDGFVEIIKGTTNEGCRVRGRDTPSAMESVEAISIVSLMKQFNIPLIDILKLDIEGAEKAIFGSDVSGWISCVKALIFEPPDKEAALTTMRIFERLLEAHLEFNCFVHGENIVLIRRDVDWTLESDIFLFRQ